MAPVPILPPALSPAQELPQTQGTIRARINELINCFVRDSRRRRVEFQATTYLFRTPASGEFLNYKSLHTRIGEFRPLVLMALTGKLFCNRR